MSLPLFKIAYFLMIIVTSLLWASKPVRDSLWSLSSPTRDQSRVVPVTYFSNLSVENHTVPESSGFDPLCSFWSLCRTIYSRRFDDRA